MAKKTENGVDLSYFQEDIDFNAVKKSGIDFAIIRSSYRNSVDDKFFSYVKGCKKAGIEIAGVYHFIYGLNVTEVKEEAKLAAKLVRDAGLPNSTIIFSDIEYDTISKAAKKGVILNRSECNEFTVAFCEKVKELGFKTGIYTNLDYYKNMYTSDVLAKYMIWLADYSGDPDYPCTFHQYSNVGRIPGIKGNVDLDYKYSDSKNSKSRSRNKVVNLVNSWVGKTGREIIDIYNSYKGSFPRGTKMEYGWAWCAATWSALAIKLGYTDIMPIEISCYYIIEEAKKMGIWQENDAYVPKPGDAVLYDWDDSGSGDNIGVPDHIGTVTFVDEKSGYMIVTEGNYDNRVKKRTVSLNGKYIRGFIAPRYTDDSVVTTTTTPGQTVNVTKENDAVAKEVIVGIWGVGEARKKALTASGYNYELIQRRVNEILNTPKLVTIPEGEKVDAITEATCKAKGFDKKLAGTYVTTADLYCRNDAGTNKKALCLIPKGTAVNNYGYYTETNGARWLYIRFVLGGVQYTGFSSSAYLRKKVI